MEFGPTDTASQVFEKHFQRLLEPLTYDRVKAIFDEAGAYNERSMAIQIQSALQSGKLEEVLESYEELLTNPDFQQLDFVARCVYLRRYADYVYGGIITDGDPMQILEMRPPAEILEIFDRMA